MHRYRIRILWLSSFLIIFSSCGTSPYLQLEHVSEKNDCIAKFNPEFTTVIYQTSINVTGKHLSGLLIFKNMPDSSTRVVFTSETGITFFDFEFAEPGFRVISIMKKLDRKPVISQLKKDIGMLLMHNMKGPANMVMATGNELYSGFRTKKEITWYITDNHCNTLTRIESASERKKKVIVNLTGFNGGLPDSAYIDHKLFEFNISLKKIER